MLLSAAQVEGVINFSAAPIAIRHIDDRCEVILWLQCNDPDQRQDILLDDPPCIRGMNPRVRGALVRIA